MSFLIHIYEHFMASLILMSFEIQREFPQFQFYSYYPKNYGTILKFWKEAIKVFKYIIHIQNVLTSHNHHTRPTFNLSSRRPSSAITLKCVLPKVFLYQIPGNCCCGFLKLNTSVRIKMRLGARRWISVAAALENYL